MPKMDTMIPSFPCDLFPIQLVFCFCLFGFVGTIISTSVFLKWQEKKICLNSNCDDGSDSDSHSKPLYSEHGVRKQHHNLYKPYRNQIEGQYHHSQSDLYQHTPPPCNEGHQSYHKSYLLLPHHHHHHHHQDAAIGSTQIILDWDDTLFPTAYTLLNMKNGKTNSKYIDDYSWMQLEALTNTVLCLLLMFVELFGSNNVHIVTNAKLSWWNDSCLMYKKLYSEIHELVVNTYHIRVISAHDLYSRKKSSAFMDLLNNKRNVKQVICIGDSNDEYEAIHSVCSVLRITGKRRINYYRFKLLESPSLDAMIKQLESIKQLDYNVISKQKYDQSYTFK